MRGGLAALAVIAAGVMLPFCNAARGENFDSFCARPGFAPALRQTIIVLDEQHVFAEGNDQRDARNEGWRRFIGAFLLPNSGGTLEQNFLPRERVTLLLARKDGAGLTPVFSGCLPFFSPGERARIATSNGGIQAAMNDFFGFGDVAGAKHAMDLFRIQLGNAVRAALDPGMLSHSNQGQGGLANSSLINSLKQGALVNFAYGLPRIVLYSDMQRFFGDLPPSADGARQLGFKQAAVADLNLRNAEVYVVGVSGGGRGHDALESFFLASHGDLIGTSSAASLPAFLAPPRRVGRFQGLMVYPDNRYPIRVRLAVDENGTLVNSWISVQTSNEQFVPLHGTLTCNDDGCIFSGDQTFAQIWNTARGAGRPPQFNPSLPFGGARTFSFKLKDLRLTGSISDSLVQFDGRPQLEFTAGLQPTAGF